MRLYCLKQDAVIIYRALFFIVGDNAYLIGAVHHSETEFVIS